MLKTACSAEEDSDDDGEMNALPAKKSRRKQAPGSCFFKEIGILGNPQIPIFITLEESCPPISGEDFGKIPESNTSETPTTIFGLLAPTCSLH